MTSIADLREVGIRARRRVASRLLPFVFLLYVVNYIDFVNVSFADLRMSADLGFSDQVYGLGVGIFYLTYVCSKYPGRSLRHDFPLAISLLLLGSGLSL